MRFLSSASFILFAALATVSCGSNADVDVPLDPADGDAGADVSVETGVPDDDTDGGPSGCQPLSCEEQGIECGPAGDGCGGTHRVRKLHGARNLRWWRRVQQMRRKRRMRAPHLRRHRRRHLRPRRRRLRRPHRVRTLHGARNVRRRGYRQPMRSPHLLHPEDLRRLRPEHLWASERRLRRHHSLLELHTSRALRRRPDEAWTMRRPRDARRWHRWRQLLHAEVLRRLR